MKFTRTAVLVLAGAFCANGQGIGRALGPQLFQQSGIAGLRPEQLTMLDRWITSYTREISSRSVPASLDGTPESRTAGLTNGRLWKSIPGSSKIVYVVSVTEAFAVIGKVSEYAPASLTIEEFTYAVDRFYQEPENLPIPVIRALKLVTMKINGADSVLIDAETQAARKAVSQISVGR